MNSKRISDVTAVFAEVLAALGGAIALTLAGTVALTAVILLLFPSVSLRAEVPLQQMSVEAMEPLSHDDLIQRLESEGVARNVQIVTRGDVTRLVLEGVKSQSTAEVAVERALGAGGYRLAAIEFLPLSDPSAIVKNMAVVIPALLIQATIFILIGGAMIWWRVAPPAVGLRMPTANSLAYGVGGGLVAIAVSQSLAWVLETVGLPVTEQPILEELFADPGALVKLAPWIVLAMPVAEEVFFRGYLYRFITQRISLTAGMLVSSVLFAVVHMNLSGFLVYVALGMIFALAYQRTSNLLTPVTAHVTYNGLLVLYMFLGL